jgi:hypothetical protein
LILAVSAGVADVGNGFIDQQPIRIASALIIAGSVGAACLWLEGRFRKLTEDRQERDQKIADHLAVSDKTMGERLARIEQKIEDLPCSGHKCTERTKEH